MLVSKNDLKLALNQLGSSIEKKDQSLIGSYVFFEATDTGVNLTTCDGDFYTEISLVVDSSISFDINFKELKKFIGTLKNDSVEFSIVDNKVKIVSGDHNIKLDQYSVNNEDMHRYEHEIINGENYPHDIIINDSIFNAIDRHNPKFELNGLLVDFRNGKIVSTDTRRLSYSSIEVEDLDSIIIPKQALKLGSTISNMHFDKNHIHYTLNGIKKRSILIPGKYPDWNRIIPSHNQITIAINGLGFKDKLKGMGDCNLDFRDNIVVVKSLKNNSSVSLPCDFPSSQFFSMDINSIYLFESIEDNRIEICINGSHLPITLKNLDCKNETVIMPIILGEDHNHYNNILDDLKLSILTFKYSKEVKKVVKKVNKDAIIKELQNDIVELRKRLASFEDDNSVVKNKVFKDTLSKCKKAS